MAKWVCNVCGYVHEGDTPPEACPVCKAPASKFTKQEDGTYVYELKDIPVGEYTVSETQRCAWSEGWKAPMIETLNIYAYTKDRNARREDELERYKRTH